MTAWSMTDARSRLSALIRLVENGEEVQITRRGRAVAVLKAAVETPFESLSPGGLLAYTHALRVDGGETGLELAPFVSGRRSQARGG